MRTINFNNEDYATIKEAHLSRGLLFEDESFPSTAANVESLSGQSPSPPEFKRPKEITERAVLKNESPPGVICLGALLNVNVNVAMSIISDRPELLRGLFPDLKDINTLSANYCGVVRVRFWLDGVSTFVVVDDKLPMLNGKLICPHSSYPDEFWPSILVKAYAKLLGGYSQLENLRLEDALQDLTGCALDTLSFQNLSKSTEMTRVSTFERLQQALSNGAIVLLCSKTDLVTSSPKDTKENLLTKEDPEVEKVDDAFDELCAPRKLGNIDQASGLCSNYVYMLTKTCVVPKDTSAMGSMLTALKINKHTPQNWLLRLRSVLSVHSKATSFGEWKGAYSEGSEEWEALTQHHRKRIGLVTSTDSEFWMPLSAMVNYFAGAVIARLPKTGIFGNWSLAEFDGIWRDHNSGGGLDFRDTFLNNPQYLIEMTRDAPEEILVSLNRKYNWDHETQAIIQDGSQPAIGIALLKVESNRDVRVHRLSTCRVIDVHPAKRHRAVFGHYLLTKGRYVLVPFLQEPQQEADYYLRLFMPRNLVNKELLHDKPSKGAFEIFTGAPILITRLEIIRGTNLGAIKTRGTGSAASSPYCKVSCEGSSCTGFVARRNNNPTWNETFLFYRIKPAKNPIRIEVYDKRSVGPDEFLGEGHLTAPESTGNGDFEVHLYSRARDKEDRVRLKGTISVGLTNVDMENYMEL